LGLYHDDIPSDAQIGLSAVCFRFFKQALSQNNPAPRIVWIDKKNLNQGVQCIVDIANLNIGHGEVSPCCVQGGLKFQHTSEDADCLTEIPLAALFDALPANRLASVLASEASS